uniref:Uncharacterized protein n=1 Tax=Anopheles dirus TaxID=7168 RepID=A0A182NN28_9DIPT
METQRLKYQRDHPAILRADAYAYITDLASLEHIINKKYHGTQHNKSLSTYRYMRAQY